MGQTLSEPVTEKHSHSGADDRFAFGLSSMQGWRISMEDAHAAELDLVAGDASPTEPTPIDKRISFFGVYDGHGGDKVAIYTGEHLHKIIARQEAFGSGNFERALKDGFLAADRAILDDPRYEDEVSGCTASAAILTSKKIYCGNAGDSRTVLGIKGRAKPLSHDHKPQNEGEKARITAAGGFVDFGRVNGNLALSRAIGDFEFKKGAELPPEQQIVTAYPDVIEHDLSADDEFLVIACDGIWDCMSSQAVVEFVRRGIVAKQALNSIAENLMDNCLAPSSDTGGVGCDNMTVIVIGILNGKSKDEWYKLVADRVSAGDGPCAPPEYAEFRGPGVHHRHDDNSDEYEMDMDQRTRFGALGSRIILLSDGSELTRDSEDSDLFDNEDEEQDLESQVNKHESEAGDGPGSEQEARTQRENTPGPSSQLAAEAAADLNSPSSVKTEASDKDDTAAGASQEATKAPETSSAPAASPAEPAAEKPTAGAS